jgi:hypothetical protein
VALERLDDGSTLNVYVNDVLADSISNATLVGGEIGVYCYSASAVLDDFRGGDGSPISAPPVKRSRARFLALLGAA